MGVNKCLKLKGLPFFIMILFVSICWIAKDVANLHETDPAAISSTLWNPNKCQKLKGWPFFVMIIFVFLSVFYIAKWLSCVRYPEAIFSSLWNLNKPLGLAIFFY